MLNLSIMPDLLPNRFIMPEKRREAGIEKCRLATLMASRSTGVWLVCCVCSHPNSGRLLACRRGRDASSQLRFFTRPRLAIWRWKQPLIRVYHHLTKWGVVEKEPPGKDWVQTSCFVTNNIEPKWFPNSTQNRSDFYFMWLYILHNLTDKLWMNEWSIVCDLRLIKTASSSKISNFFPELLPFFLHQIY